MGTWIDGVFADLDERIRNLSKRRRDRVLREEAKELQVRKKPVGRRRGRHVVA